MTRWVRRWAGLVAGVVLAGGAGGQDAGPDEAGAGAALSASVSSVGSLELGPTREGRAFVERAMLSMPGQARVELTLRRVRVATGATRFVRGRRGGADEPIAFDPESVVLLRGKGVDGQTTAFIVITPSLTTGWIQHDGVSLTLHGGPSHADGSMSLSVAAARPGFLGPICGVMPADGESRLLIAGTPGTLPGPGSPQLTEGPEAEPLWTIDLAIETDYELYALFDDPDATLAYVVALYGAIGEILTRDVDAGLNLTFVRIWDTPDDMFNATNPLGEFRSFWENNMAEVERDLAQFCSGRRDLPFGGVAFLNGLCRSTGYSVAGYMLGFWETLDNPDPFARDVIVAAHEIGHNVGALHTHDYGLDICNLPDGPPTRGTIMSYCGQTRMGGSGNMDIRFHTFVRGVIRDTIADIGVPCVLRDCNANGIHDDDDIASGASLDLNANGIPDECEDCNGNGVLDSLDIASGRSFDFDFNGVPDECQPDCNGNFIPDVIDISIGSETDIDGDGIPDSCQSDCDGDGVADIAQILGDMSLDIDRNRTLDDCQDCDGDGINDLIALDHSHNIWVATLAPERTLREFHGYSGVLTTVSAGASFDQAYDLILTPDRRVLVSSAADDRVVEFALDGSFVGDLVASGAGGLDEPAGLLVTDRDSLLVASRSTNQVLEYDLASGSFLGAFIDAGVGGLVGPFGLAFAPGRNLVVTTSDARVLEFDASTGAFVRTLVSTGDNGGMIDPRGLVYKHDGNLLVASHGSNALLEYDGSTGAFVRVFNSSGANGRLTLEEPWTVRVGPDGHIYTSISHIEPEGLKLHLTAARIYQYHRQSGNFMRALVQGNDSGLWQPTGFDFVPDAGTDCNGNFLPDSCDIASGRSLDLDGDGIPDECQACPGDLTTTADPDEPGFGVPDRVVDAIDFFYYLDRFAAGDPLVDLTGTTDPNNPRYGVPDSMLDASDFFFYLQLFVAGCP